MWICCSIDEGSRCRPSDGGQPQRGRHVLFPIGGLGKARGVEEEDPEKAFALFERAAKLDHTAALYMVADCLVEGEGTERSVAKAVPLFYKAAERGHRYSRQRIRELLARVEYPL